MKKAYLMLGIVVMVGIILSQQVLAQDQILVKESIQYDGPGHVPDEIIVKFKPGVGRSEIAKINSQHGTSVVYTSPFAGFKRIKIPKGLSAAKMVERFSKNPNVEYAELNNIVHAFGVPNDPYYSYQWHLDNSMYGGIGMEEAWDLSDGAGVIVAVIDTGVAHHPTSNKDDLAGTSFVAGYDFVNNDDDPTDDHGHGTHVTGTIAQSTNNGRGVAGVAHGCSIMPVKVLNSAGSGTDAGVADGILFAADNGAQVINMSLGGPDWSETLQEAVAYAYNQGVTIICASGNEGSYQVSYPAAYDNCIAVGATTYDEGVAPYSNRGDSLDLTAPGGNLYEDLNGDGYVDGVLQQTFSVSWFGKKTWGYYFFQGTSMAAPHVSGVAALVISHGVATTPDGVRVVLESTAEDKGAAGWDTEYGWGIVDAYAALRSGSGPANNPPEASNDMATTLEDTSVDIAVLTNDTDAEDDPLTVTNLTQPGNGMVSLNTDKTVTYDPDPDFYGSDSFTYTANDGKANSNVATVTVTVFPVNDEPVADAGPDMSVLVNQLVEFDGSGSYDPDDDIVSYEWDFGDDTGGSGETPNHSYSAIGTYTVTLTVTDDDGLWATDTATIIVTEESSSVMHVEDVTIDVKRKGRNIQATAYVLIWDQDSKPVQGATVTVEWFFNGSFLIEASSTTDGAGVAVLYLPKFKDASDDFAIDITDVVKDGYTYEP